MAAEWSFKKLRVWKEAMSFAKGIYKCTSEFPDTETYGLISQMRRASTSIGQNIAEGKGRDTDKDFVRFLYNARGSLYEVVSCLEIAEELEYLSEKRSKELEGKAEQIHRMISGLIEKLEEG